VTIKKLPMPLCAVDKQRAIAYGLDVFAAETQRLGSIYQRKLAAIGELRKSLLHQAFTGQLGAQIA
jgi:type I restriction enzyme S subunit